MDKPAKTTINTKPNVVIHCVCKNLCKIGDVYLLLRIKSHLNNRQFLNLMALLYEDIVTPCVSITPSK